MTEKYLFVRGGVAAFRPASRFVEIKVVESPPNTFYVEGLNQVGNDFIREPLTPNRTTIAQAEQDLLKLYTILNGDRLAFEPTPTDALALNIR